MFKVGTRIRVKNYKHGVDGTEGTIVAEAGDTSAFVTVRLDEAVDGYQNDFDWLFIPEELEVI